VRFGQNTADGGKEDDITTLQNGRYRCGPVFTDSQEGFTTFRITGRVCTNDNSFDFTTCACDVSRIRTVLLKLTTSPF
jgi:hypothetical protein